MEKKKRKLPTWLKIDNVKRILTADSIGKIEEVHRQKYLVVHYKKANLF